MHRTKIKIGPGIGTGLSVMIFVLVLLCTPVVLAMPMPPNQFYGNVTTDGKPAPDGTVVSARIAGIEFATTTTINGGYGSNSAFIVPSDDLDTTEKEGGRDGDIVDFYVVNTENELKSESAANATFSIGGVTNLDLKGGKEPEESAVIPGFLAPLTIAVLLAAAIFIAGARRGKRKCK